MQTFETYECIDVAGREIRQNYQMLISCVVPRPIAFVTTLSPTGTTNLAPFSFFNGIGGNPPAVMFSPCNSRTGKPKDTVVNLRHLGEFVINAVPYSIAEAMNEASYEYPADVSELQVCGFTAMPSVRVKPPRVAESPIHLECRLIQIVPVGTGPLAANVCIGEVLCFHVAEGFRSPDGTVDIAKLDAIGRLGGDFYSFSRDRFRLPRPTGPSANPQRPPAIEA